VYTGASVTCGELTCKEVCDELMECATSVGLSVPALLASLRQFIVELRRGDDDLGAGGGFGCGGCGGRRPRGIHLLPRRRWHRRHSATPPVSGDLFFRIVLWRGREAQVLCIALVFTWLTGHTRFSVVRPLS